MRILKLILLLVAKFVEGRLRAHMVPETTPFLITSENTVPCGIFFSQREIMEERLQMLYNKTEIDLGDLVDWIEKDLAVWEYVENHWCTGLPECS